MHPLPLHQRKKCNLSSIVPFFVLLMILCFVRCDEKEDSWMIATGVHPVQFDNVASSEKIVFSDSLLLTWRDQSVFSKDITYQVIKKDITQTTSDTFYILKNLTPNSSFLLTIRSERKRNSNISAEQSVSVKTIHDSIIPIFPTTNQVIYANPFFSWQLEHIFFSHRAFHYELYIDSSASFSNPQVFSTTHDTLTARGIAIQKDQHYFWKVAIVYDDYPEKFFSKTMTFIGANEAPSVPQPISPANNATGVASPTTFTWHPSTDPENDPITYTLEVKDPAQKIIFSQNNITDTFLQATLSLASETNYTWRVIAKDRTGASPSISFTFKSLWYPFLDIDKTTIYIYLSGGNDTFNISTNTAWSISSPPSWLSLSTNSGTNNQRVVVTTNANSGNSSRLHTLTISSTNASLSKTITIMQESECAKNRRLDSLVLVKFYQSTNGANWKRNTGWLTNMPIHQWYGIRMTDDGCRVKNMDLSSSGVSGTIPSEIGNLSQLEYLLLGDNQLTGSIPTTIGNLTQLKSLSLATNLLSGNIPTSIGNLSQLYHLDLIYNQLSGSMPNTIGSLSSLQYLYVYENQLSGAIPATIGNLTQLKALGLSSNQFSGNIPSSIGDLTQLKYLNLYNNQLTGNVPTSICIRKENGQYSSHYSVARNSSLKDCQAIIPCAASRQEDSLVLVKLYQSTDGDNWSDHTNWLTGAPLHQWYGITMTSNGCAVNAIYLSYNTLSGNIPLEIGNFSQLQTLYLDGNQLSGNIPPAIGNLSRLEYLNLSKNNLSESIPIDIGKLSQLGALYLHENLLIGEIPSQIGALQNLQNLFLQNNQLSGKIPPEIENISELKYLRLENNKLVGNIPTRIGNLSALEYLHVENNQLSGNIPSEIGKLYQLQGLYLQNNQLSGSIPSEIGNLSLLKILNLHTNQLSGSVPASICTRKGKKQYTTYNISSNNNLTDCP